jgi:hypothetical protein
VKTAAGIIAWSLFWTAVVLGVALLALEWRVAGGMTG